jgi:hypothetical protein
MNNETMTVYKDIWLKKETVLRETVKMLEKLEEQLKKDNYDILARLHLSAALCNLVMIKENEEEYQYFLNGK